MIKLEFITWEHLINIVRDDPIVIFGKLTAGLGILIHELIVDPQESH